MPLPYEVYDPDTVLQHGREQYDYQTGIHGCIMFTFFWSESPAVVMCSSVGLGTIG